MRMNENQFGRNNFEITRKKETKTTESEKKYEKYEKIMWWDRHTKGKKYIKQTPSQRAYIFFFHSYSSYIQNAIKEQRNKMKKPKW